MIVYNYNLMLEFIASKFADMADYTIFSDDSGAGGHRFHALTLVAVPTEEVINLNMELDELLRSTGTSCTEWKKVAKQYKYTHACKALLGTTTTLATQYGVRYQTVLWDMHDARHAVQFRDDQSNKEYMYRVALVDLIKRHTITDITWHPDTEWSLDLDRVAKDVMSRIPFGPTFSAISQLRPEESPFLQIADLNAGIWRNYYEKLEPGREWYKAGRPEGCPSCSWTRREVLQYELLRWYVESLRKGGTTFELINGRLKTRAYGARPINVWPYMPQHDADRAPRKMSA